MLTGKRPTDERFNDDMNLHKFAEIALSEGVEGIADPVLLLQQGGSGKISETVASIFRIGIMCSAESPGERPDIGDVVAELLVIRKVLVGTGGKALN
ncbi:hypothetical protein RHMOL_Rhmol03G0163700 [Rhododendron molle]|uniref:Uncharacterized protein n=1 Tax=Rhododendron molle TaxID=49168 RepID=A0ACC0PEQ8_RHOML|nr:hypothetical protein RHMOL_Rhmol03G0163700 [Rhododendron molle]